MKSGKKGGPERARTTKGKGANNQRKGRERAQTLTMARGSVMQSAKVRGYRDWCTMHTTCREGREKTERTRAKTKVRVRAGVSKDGGEGEGKSESEG